jgi:nucleoside-diphosphate-sugar epimerase
MKQILLLGEDSYAATGLYELIKSQGFYIDCFSKGDENRNGDFIQGDVFSILDNPNFKEKYDFIINFIMLKNSTIEDNLRFICLLDKFCVLKKVDRLFQISSMSNYSSNVTYVDEKTDIESDYRKKGSYASIKVAVDNYINSKKSNYPVSFIRPGFIYLNGKLPSIAGIGIHLFGKTTILLGNRETTLPIIERSILHQAVLTILSSELFQLTYLIFENNNSTKDSFLRKLGYKTILPLNRSIFIILARILRVFRLFSNNQVEQVQSLFRKVQFSSNETELRLGIPFVKDSFAIIGAGTFGSYIAKRITELYPNHQITIFDVGSSIIRNEDEIGFKTNINKEQYIGTSKGRFFGFGGASVKWGGQLLVFGDNDFENPNPFLREIVDLNKKYRDFIYGKFSIKNDFIEKKIQKGLFVKTGVWLGYFSRNLFNYFKINKLPNVRIVDSSRIIRIDLIQNHVNYIEYISGKTKKKALFSNYFLCAGAFESSRLLLNSNIVKDKIPFSDHLSKKVFTIKGTPKLGEVDLTFKVKGTSLITKRFCGEINGVSFFVHPAFNSEFPFFQNLKKILFKGEISAEIILSIIKDIPSVIGFIWSMLFLKKVYVYKNKWDLYVDIENPLGKSFVNLSLDRDAFGEKALDLSFEQDGKVKAIYNSIQQIIEKFLDKNGVNYSLNNDSVQVKKIEDTYHPYGMFSNHPTIDSYFDRFENMLVVNTGILPRAGGINTAAAIFPIIEEYFNRKKF